MIRDYVSIARPNHWFKNVFMLPGVVLGWLACPPDSATSASFWLAWSLLATCLVCSSNYTINEVLDAPEDRNHPHKRTRPVAAGRIRVSWAYLQWLGLGLAGMGMAWFVGLPFFLSELALFVMGIVYNVRPLRSKDRPYLDVLSESVNNPLRLLLGWYAVRCPLIPPASLALSYWMLGAFFMAIKRFAELRHLNDRQVAVNYRKSFAHYTPELLLISVVFYATAFALFGGIFLIRYRVELILGVPFIAGFMAMYMRLGFLPDSPAQRPEQLYKCKAFTAYACLTAAILVACLIIRIPLLSRIFETTIPGGF